ncbi:MAG: RdgB/HAM1 family non-canonical purine NTP pyrophosphatase [Bacteroidetes bacterium]|nr:RdgB/HAM1 family non-canonical purine NTP pyrophosphatase [Bacteroidota bacterium]
MKLCFASNNRHKLEEIGALLGADFTLMTLQDIGCLEELPETTDTLEGNAEEKASYVWDRYHIPCFADDSGLEVEALHGAPGVYSAMYAGPHRSAEDNNRHLLEKLNEKENRKARFRAVIYLILPEYRRKVEGKVEGVILDAPRGSQGFGYDPLFLPDGCAKTLAEMSLEEKNLISHRAGAVQQLVSFLKSLR